MAMDIISSRGIDAARDARPGIPKERRPPEPVGNSHWLVPDRQEPAVPVLMHATRTELTPVFSTALPPKGLSGAIRRLAYRIPDHRARHWMLLLLADRIDVQEHRLGRVGIGVAAALGVLVLLRALKS